VDLGLAGKACVVTGASRGIGRETAVRLCSEGASVLLVARSPDELVQAAARCERPGANGRAATLRCDVTATDAGELILAEATERFGRVDVLVNNAAVFLPTPLSSLTVSSWQTILRTNLTAPFVLALFLGRTMRAHGSGKIVQLGDWSGMRPLPGYLPYCVSKGGMHVLTQVLAKALAPQVQVNSVALGPVLPPAHYDAAARRALVNRTPLRRLGKTADVVRAVRFLVEAGEFVTGTTYMVDGGWSASAVGGTGTSV